MRRAAGVPRPIEEIFVYSVGPNFLETLLDGGEHLFLPLAESLVSHWTCKQKNVPICNHIAIHIESDNLLHKIDIRITKRGRILYAVILTKTNTEQVSAEFMLVRLLVIAKNWKLL